MDKETNEETQKETSNTTEALNSEDEKKSSLQDDGDGGDGDDHATQEQGRREQHLLPSIERISLSKKKDKKDGTQHTFWDTQVIHLYLFKAIDS